jgi:alpha-ketoglutarate-dependent 2,4-dichlorophenoxyacetate dioxygenase
MALTITSLQGNIAGQVSGLDLRNGISPEAVEEIEKAFGRYVVLVFPNQPIDDDIQQDFIQKFGPPIVTNAIKELARKIGHRPHLLDIATVDEDGVPLAQGSFLHLYMLANQIWHTDGSQVQPPIRLTALSARTLPSTPPDTEYADMRAAWDALSSEKQEEIEDLQVEHSIVYSRSLLGLPKEAFSEESMKSRPPVAHRLVRTHPVSGRKSLYLSSHASHIIGWPIEKGRQLLKELTDLATERRFVYAHKWRPEDLVMWDDRCSMHRALPYNGPQPRVLRWSAVQELEPV